MTTRIIYFTIALTGLMLPDVVAGFSDPTRPPGFGGDSSAAIVPHEPPVRGLQSVVISEGRCAAIIDGKTVLLGEKHGDERLVEVSRDSIVFRGSKGLRKVSLFPGVGMKHAAGENKAGDSGRCVLGLRQQTENPEGNAGEKEKK